MTTTPETTAAYQPFQVRLTAAQQSALECREDGGLEPLTLRARARGNGRALLFTEDEREQLWGELNDASNAEDAQDCPYARRAAMSLSKIAGRVLTVTRRKGQGPLRQA